MTTPSGDPSSDANLPRTPDLAARHRFLDAVFELVPLTEQLIVSRFQPNATLVGGIGDWAEMSQRVDAKLRCTYFAVASRSAEFVSVKGSRGSTADIGHLPALYLDLDVDDGGHKNTKGLFPTMQDALDYIAAIKVKPSAVVMTGHGAQVLWFLNKPLAVADAVRATAEFHDLQPRIQQRLYGAFGKDVPGPDQAVTGDPCRVLRLPETPNLKVEGDPRWCEVVTENYSQRYDITALLAAFKASGEDPAPKKSTSPTTTANTSTATKSALPTPGRNALPPTVAEFLDGLGRDLHPAARAYLEADVQTRRDQIRDALVDKLGWEVVGEFDDEHGTAYHMLRPGGSSAQSATIGGSVDAKTDWSTGQTLDERCISDAMIVWSSAASPFCDQPEAQRTAFPTFDGLRILKLLGVIPEDVPVTAKFDRETGGHTYEVDDRKLDGWKPSTVPTVLREKAHTFVSILDKLGQEPPPPNHGEHEGFSVSMFPDIVVREARRRFLRDDFLSPMARVMQVYMEGVLACSGADVVQRFPGSDDMMRSDAIVLWMMITGQSGVGKDSLVSNITSDVVGPLIAKYLDCYPRVSLPSLPTFGDDDVEGIDGSTDLTPEQKAQVDQASKLIEQMRRALYVDPYVIVTSAKSTEGLMSATAASPVLVVAASEGRDILTAFGVQGRADEPDSSMNERWDCQSSKAIRAASMSGKDDRYVTNSPINVFAAIQPSVAALLLCNVGGKSTGMVQRFLTSPFFGLIEGFDDVAPLPTGEWERVTGALFAGLLQHAFNSAVLVRTVDKNLRVQTWGRTQVFCDDAAAKRFKDAVKWTLNSEDEADIGATMGAKRPRKAITAAGVAVLLEGMRQYLTTNPMPSPSQLESVVSTNHLNNFSPIISGSPAFVAGESFGGMKGAEQRLPYVRWQVEERHFDQALALVEALEEFMLRQLPSLDETRRSDEVELQATGDVIKAQGQLHAVARGRGDKLDLDMILRAAYLASVPLFDADGWFHASRSAGPRACRRAVQVLGDRQLLDDGRYLESKTVGKKKLFRWMIQLDDSAIETTGVEVAA